MFEGVDDEGRPRPPTTRSPCRTPTTSTCWHRTPWRCARRPTTWSSTAGSWARAPSGSTAPTSSARSSTRWASRPRRPRRASASCSAPSATARRPTAGFAVGVDRLVAMLAGEENIREVIAFPKTQSGADPMTGAPKALGPRRPGRARPAGRAGAGVLSRGVGAPVAGRTSRRPRDRAGRDLFDEAASAAPGARGPLAARLRPRTLDEVVGQRHLVAPGCAAARAHRAGPADLGDPVGPAGHGQDHPRPGRGRGHGKAFVPAVRGERRGGRRARGDRGGPPAPRRAGPGHDRSSSTRCTGSTGPSRTPCSRPWRRG